MILLDSGHAMLRDIIGQRLGSENAGNREDFETVIADFDDVSYKVTCEGTHATIFIHLPGYPEIAKYGVEDYLRSVYGADVVGPGGDVKGTTFHVSLNINLEQDLGDKTDAFLESISQFKRNCLAAPFLHAFKQVASRSPDVIVVPFRDADKVYIKITREGSVVVVFQMRFREASDLIIADVFMKDFSEVRRESSLSQAPSISFSKTAPGELQGLSVAEGADIAFVSFVLFDRHFTAADKAEKSITSLLNFRNELPYHIKCSKAYLHTRMRQRVANMLQVLNRAKPESVGGEKKTATGRTFVRK